MQMQISYVHCSVSIIITVAWGAIRDSGSGTGTRLGLLDTALRDVSLESLVVCDTGLKLGWSGTQLLEDNDM